MWFDSKSSSLYVTEFISGRTRVISPDGNIQADRDLPTLGGAVDAAIASNGTKLFAIIDKNFVGTPSGQTLREVAGKSSNSGGATGDNGAATSALLKTPMGLAADPSKPDRFWIADSANHRVRRVDGGTITTAAGTISGYSGDGGLATAAKLSNCTAVAVDASGNLYIADTGAVRRACTADACTVSFAFCTVNHL
jgi:hypothetical protein